MLISLALATSLLTHDPIPERLRGSTLYNNCKADSQTHLMAATECMDYISGFVDAALSARLICPSENATNGTVVRIYLQFMDQHPELLDENRYLGLEGSLITAYPCTKH